MAWPFCNDAQNPTSNAWAPPSTWGLPLRGRPPYPAIMASERAAYSWNTDTSAGRFHVHQNALHQTLKERLALPFNHERDSFERQIWVQLDSKKKAQIVRSIVHFFLVNTFEIYVLALAAGMLSSLVQGLIVFVGLCSNLLYQMTDQWNHFSFDSYRLACLELKTVHEFSKRLYCMRHICLNPHPSFVSLVWLLLSEMQNRSSCFSEAIT